VFCRNNGHGGSNSFNVLVSLDEDVWYRAETEQRFRLWIRR